MVGFGVIASHYRGWIRNGDTESAEEVKNQLPEQRNNQGADREVRSLVHEGLQEAYHMIRQLWMEVNDIMYAIKHLESEADWNRLMEDLPAGDQKFVRDFSELKYRLDLLERAALQRRMLYRSGPPKVLLP